MQNIIGFFSRGRNTIKLVTFKDKRVKEIIAYQTEKYYEKFEKQLQTWREYLKLSKEYYVTKTDPSNTTKVLLANFDDNHAKIISNLDDKHAKQDENFKESVNAIIKIQDAKVEEKFETKIQPLSLQIKEVSPKQGEQANILSTYT